QTALDLREQIATASTFDAQCRTGWDRYCEDLIDTALWRNERRRGRRQIAEVRSHRVRPPGHRFGCPCGRLSLLQPGGCGDARDSRMRDVAHLREGRLFVNRPLTRGAAPRTSHQRGGTA